MHLSRVHNNQEISVRSDKSQILYIELLTFQFFARKNLDIVPERTSLDIPQGYLTIDPSNSNMEIAYRYGKEIALMTALLDQGLAQVVIRDGSLRWWGFLVLAGWQGLRVEVDRALGARGTEVEVVWA